jgi:F0F1-type ATP synthase membrane subunit a
MFSSKQAIYVDLDKAYSEFILHTFVLFGYSLLWYICSNVLLMFYACSYGFTADSSFNYTLSKGIYIRYICIKVKVHSVTKFCYHHDSI